MVSTLIAYGIMYGGMSLAAATFVATFAVNFAVSYLVTRLFADSPEQQQDMGVRQQVPPSAVNAIPIVYGTAYLGGTFIDAVLSTNQKAMYYVLAVSSISPSGQFVFDQTDMYYGDRKITFDATDPAKVISLTDEAGNVDTKINNFLYIGLYTSSQAGVISNQNWYSPSVVMGPTTPFTDYPIAAGQQWPTTGRQMNGTAFAIVTLIYSQDANTTQLAPITFKAVHTLNGTGVAKPGDVWYDYITNSVYGGAVDAAFVDGANAAVLNTYSDEVITFTNASGNPSTQPRYRINGVLDAGKSVLSNIDRIMSSCDSWLQYNATLGKWAVVVNKAENALYSFNDSNIIGEVRVSATDITGSINQVEARFPFKQNRDQAAYINIETPAGLLYPNEPINKYSLTYDLVNDSVQAHYLANRLLEQAREDLIVSFSTTYYGIQVDAGNVVSVTNADYGWSSKLFRVMKVNEASLADGTLGARLDLTEYNAQIYDNKDITQFTPVPNSGLASVSYFSPLSAPTVTGFPTVTIPNFNVQVFIPTTGRVTFANLFYTTSATPTAADWKQLSTASSSDSTPVTNATNYTFTNIVANTGVYYFAYVVGNDIGKTNLSPISAVFNWNPVAAVGPTGPTGASLTGPTGASITGPTGNSSRICYSKTTSSSLSPTPLTITTSGDASFPPNDSWGAGTVWGATSPVIVEGESVYQSDGVYSPVVGSTVWNVPYLSTLKVGALSAITTNTGTLTVSPTGYLRGGQTDFNTGTGFFLGYSSANYTFSIGSVKTGTGDVGTDAFTSTSHGYSNFQQITFLDIGSLSGIVINKPYLVINATTNTFELGTSAGVLINITGTSSAVKFTAQAMYWNGTQLNFSGNLIGGTIGIGNGSALGGTAFSVTSTGVVSCDNLFGGVALFDNTAYPTITSAQGTSWGNVVAVIGAVAGANAGTNAHGVRGQNFNANTSGLVGVANGYDFYADGAGTNYGPFTGNHDILLPIDQTITEGTLVVDVQCIARNSWSNAIFQVAPSTQANQAGARGVFVGELRPLSSVKPPVFIDHWEYVDNVGIPVMTAQYDLIKDDYWFGSINSLGEGQIQVCGENGNIAVDTLIVASGTTGVGMAQSDGIVRGYTVAKAREAVSFSSPNAVQVVACIYVSG
jgi:hypothetical protein